MPAIHPSKTNLKGLPGSEASALLRSRGLTIVLGALGCVLSQVEPLPEACTLQGFWPRSLTLLHCNTSVLLLNSSLLQDLGPGHPNQSHRCEGLLSVSYHKIVCHRK